MIYVYVSQMRGEAERARRIQAVAAAKGWSYLEKDPETRKELGLPFGWGSQAQYNFVRGKAGGAAFVMFDYIITTKNSRIERSWAAFRLPEQAPRFRVIPNTWRFFLDRGLTWERLRFPQDLTFSDTYRVESPDGPRAAAVFTDAVRSRLNAAPGLSIVSRNGWLQLSGPAFAAPEELEPFLNRSLDVARPFLNL